jgi:hypothetical protein
MDMCAGDAGMFVCVNGHTICQDEAAESFEQWMAESNESEALDDGYGSGYYYDVPEKYCPFCLMIEFAQPDLKQYLKIKTKITEDEAFATVKAANKRRKKLYDAEYVMYTLTKTGEKMENLIAEIKAKYTTYKEFSKSLYEN